MLSGDAFVQTMKNAESLAHRLRQAREHLGLTQADAAYKTGIPLVSYKKYESSKATPGGDALTTLGRMEINLHWLLTGEGPMLLTDLYKPPLPLDMDRLVGVIREFEEALQRHCRALDPQRKARAIAVLYEYVTKAGPQDPATVERILELMN